MYIHAAEPAAGVPNQTSSLMRTSLWRIWGESDRGANEDDAEKPPKQRVVTFLKQGRDLACSLVEEC